MIELTDHVKAYNWPEDLRLVIRREPLHPRANFPVRLRTLPILGTLDRPTPTRPRIRPRHARPRPSRNPHRVKDHGGNRFPFARYAPNRLWLHIVALADTLVRWFQKLSLPKHHPLTRAKPKTLRPNLWHIPGVIARHSRQTTLRIPPTWPTATLIATTHQHIHTI